MIKKQLILLILPLLLLFGCNHVVNEYRDIPEFQWEKSNVITIDHEAQASDEPHTVLLGFRHYAGIEYAQVLTKLKVTTPSGEELGNTYVINLRDEETGELLGGTMGDITDLEVPVVSDFTFAESGTYHFEISHGMEVEKVSGIMEVGLVIKKIGEGEEG